MAESATASRLTAVSAGNLSYLESIYAQLEDSPGTVSENWKEIFKQLESACSHSPHHPVRERSGTLVSADSIRRQAAVQRLIRRYQVYGHLNARLDPLELPDVGFPVDLSLASVGLHESDLSKDFKVDAVDDQGETLALAEIIEFFEEAYCGTVGYEYMHISDPERIEWIRQRVEKVHLRPVITDADRLRILTHLTAAESMETYLHTKYVGQKRFSLEGGESLIPMLRDLVEMSGEAGGKEVVIGMAHRGRLNVLVNILGKSPNEVFGEFEGNIPIGGSSWHRDHGDVKYHQGFSADINTAGGIVHVALAFNPSHLEIINSVVQGSVRARQHRRKDLARDEVVPILIHGDAAFSGQGVVMESLNMSHTRGFQIGGTIHVIINNQIGFTTSNILDARSTVYCTEVAKMVQAPIFHVNGDDPEAVCAVAQLAHAYRMHFHTDVVIDLVCYRRYGHNEADEPMMTQPIMYDAIRKLTPVRRKYASQLIDRGVIAEEEAAKLVMEYRDNLDQGEMVAGQIIDPAKMGKIVDWTRFEQSRWFDPVDTTVKENKIGQLNRQLQVLPEGFSLHKRVSKIMADRAAMAAGERPLDWGFAETMAYASLIDQGFKIRLTGEDVGRGTFSHRHALLHDQKSRKVHCPLQTIREPSDCQIYNSLLSEEAVLGFEYGYATTDPESLVIWEAQFGDFANGAQIVIDQFISSGYAKWARFCGLVLLLPHGYEGQGPEHSSARLERFLQLCAGENMQVCVPTTPAQLFHMLRRQVLRPYRRPLVVMSPKSLLRHKRSVSSLQDLTRYGFKAVMDETDPNISKANVRRVVACAGKVYFDLIDMREHLSIDDIAIVRIEQLHPFPTPDLVNVLQTYPNAKDIMWCQEEPRNQGAWYQIWHQLRECRTKGQKLLSVARDSAASPAVGNYRVHLAQQERLVTDALSIAKNVFSISATRNKKTHAN